MQDLRKPPPLPGQTLPPADGPGQSTAPQPPSGTAHTPQAASNPQQPAGQPPLATQQPAQVYQQPTGQPPLTALQPAQAYQQPTGLPPLAAQQPAQAYQQPTGQPAQAYQQPTGQPPLTAQQPAQAYQQPTGQPPLTAQQPAQAYQQPTGQPPLTTKAYQQPPQAAQQPVQAYQQPVEQPPLAPQQPAQAYQLQAGQPPLTAQQQPAQAYQQPARQPPMAGYQPGQQSYQHPAQAFQQPTGQPPLTGYQPGQQPYQQPGQAFQQPPHGYQPHGQGYRQPQEPQDPPAVFTVGCIFREAYAFATRRPVPALAFPLGVPVLSALSQMIGIESPLAQFAVNMLLMIAYMGTMGAVAAAAADPGGIELDHAECLRLSFARVPGFLALMVIIFLLAIGISIPLGLVMAFSGITGSSSSLGTIVVGVIAFALFMFWIYVAFCLTLPAMVVEEMGPMAALRRSRELTHGNRLKILWVFILAAALPAISLSWAYYDLARSPDGDILHPSLQFLAFVGLMYAVLNILVFSLVAVIYTNCASISASTRVNDFSEVF